MSSLPSFSGRQIIKILSKFGFENVRTKGSHNFLKHLDGRATVVPVHGNESIGIGLFHKILNDCEITVEKFLEKV